MTEAAPPADARLADPVGAPGSAPGGAAPAAVPVAAPGGAPVASPDPSSEGVSFEEHNAGDVGLNHALKWTALFHAMTRHVKAARGLATVDGQKLEKFETVPDERKPYNMSASHARYKLPRGANNQNEFQLIMGKGDKNWWLPNHVVHVPKENMAEFHVRYGLTLHHALEQSLHLRKPSFVYPIVKRLGFKNELGVEVRPATKPFFDIDWKISFDTTYVQGELELCQKKFPVTFGNKASWLDFQDKHFVPNFSTDELEYLGKIAVRVFAKSFIAIDGTRIIEDDVVALITAPIAASIDNLRPELSKTGDKNLCELRFCCPSEPTGKLSCHIFLVHRRMVAQIPDEWKSHSGSTYQSCTVGSQMIIKLWDRMQDASSWLLSKNDWRSLNKLLRKELDGELKKSRATQGVSLPRGKLLGLPPEASIMQGMTEERLFAAVDDAAQTNLLMFGTPKFKDCAICELVRVDEDFRGQQYCGDGAQPTFVCAACGKDSRLSVLKMKSLQAIVIGQCASRALLEVLGSGALLPTMFNVFATTLVSANNEEISNVVLNPENIDSVNEVQQKEAMHNKPKSGKTHFKDPAAGMIVQSVINGRADIGTNKTQQRYPVQMLLSSDQTLKPYFNVDTDRLTSLPRSLEQTQLFGQHLWREASVKIQNGSEDFGMSDLPPRRDEFEMDEALTDIAGVDFCGMILSQGMRPQRTEQFEKQYGINVMSELKTWGKTATKQGYTIDMSLMTNGMKARGIFVKLVPLPDMDDKEFTFCWYLFEQLLKGIGKNGEKTRPWKYWDMPGTPLENSVGYAASSFEGVFTGEVHEMDPIPKAVFDYHYPGHDSSGHMACWEIDFNCENRKHGPGDFHIVRTCFRCKKQEADKEVKYRSPKMKLHWSDSRTLHQLLDTDPEGLFKQRATALDLSNQYGKRVSVDCMRDPVCREKTPKQAAGIYLARSAAAKRPERFRRFGD